MNVMRGFLTIGAFCLSAAPALVAAEAAPRGGGAADPRLQMLVQQLTAEKVALTTQKTRLEEEVAALKEKVDDLEGRYAKTSKALKDNKAD